MVDGVMFNLVSVSSRKLYNSMNKVILKYCFEADNNHPEALTKWALNQLEDQKLHRGSRKEFARVIDDFVSADTCPFEYEKLIFNFSQSILFTGHILILVPRQCRLIIRATTKI